jgi:hypothetical protein
MAFRDLTDVLGATSPKVLPIRGASVEFPGAISAWAGQMLLAIRRMAAQQVEEGGSDASTARVVLDAGLITEQDGLRLEGELLGDGAQALDDLGVFGDGRQRVISTLMTWHLSGQEAAEVVWEGKAPTPNRATKRRTAGSSSRTGGTARASSRTGAGASSEPRKRATRRGTSG